MTPQEQIAQLQRKLASYNSEMGKAMRTNHDLRVEKKNAGADCVAMRKSMNEIYELANSGQIREMLEVIENERRIYEARREQRKVRAA